MIEVHRKPKPSILAKKAHEWRNSLLSAKTQAERVRVEYKYRHRQIKETLVRSFHGKCAYCESKITHVDYGHIEHFRPKRGVNGRPELTFEWTNLLLACGVCNGAQYKSDRFPEANNGGPIINPCEEAPTSHFHFVFDPTAKLASVYGKTRRGVTTEKLLGLNRLELREYRSRHVRTLLVLAHFAQTDPEAARLLAEAKKSYAEYAAFARALE